MFMEDVPPNSPSNSGDQPAELQDPLQKIVRSGRQGDVESAKRLLEIVAEELESGKKLSPQVAEYLAHGFWKILAGKDANLALNLLLSGVTHIDWTGELDIAIDYWKIRVTGEQPYIARKIVADSWGVPEHQVKMIVRRFKNAVKEVMDLRQRLKIMEAEDNRR